MSEPAILRVLGGERTAFCAGITWVGDELRASLGGNSPAALAEVASDVRADFAFVAADSDSAVQDVAELVARGIEPVWAVVGPLGRIAFHHGWTKVLKASASHFGSLQADLDSAMRGALEDVRAGAACGVRVQVIADDLASSEGWLVSPQSTEVLLPLYRSFARAVSAASGHSMFHSDGDISALCPQLVQVGFEAVHVGAVPFDRLGSVLEAVRAHGLVPAGGIPSALGAWDRDLVSKCARIAQQGPILLCDDGGLVSSEDLATLARVQTTVRDLIAQRRADDETRR